MANLYSSNYRLAPYGYEVQPSPLEVSGQDHASALSHPSAEHGPHHGGASLDQYSLGNHAEQLHSYDESLAAPHLADHHQHSSVHGTEVLGSEQAADAVAGAQHSPPTKALTPPAPKAGPKGKPPEEEEAITSLQKLRYSSRDPKDPNAPPMVELGPADVLSMGSDASAVGIAKELGLNGAVVAHMTADPSMMDGSMRSDGDETSIHWKCPKCGKPCKTKSSLNTHINRKHAETKDNVCQHCRKSYAIKDSLTKHMSRKHPQLTKTFVCNHYGCNKAFPTLKERQDHFSRHSKVKSFSCDYPSCPCTYTTKNSLNLHIARNHKEPRYSCPTCGEKYAVRGDLNQHERRKHGLPGTSSGEHDKLSDAENSMINDGNSSMGSNPHVIDSQQLEHVINPDHQQALAQAHAAQYPTAYGHHPDIGLEYNVVDNQIMMQSADPNDDKKSEADSGYEQQG